MGVKVVYNLSYKVFMCLFSLMLVQLTSSPGMIGMKQALLFDNILLGSEPHAIYVDTYLLESICFEDQPCICFYIPLPFYP